MSSSTSEESGLQETVSLSVAGQGGPTLPAQEVVTGRGMIAGVSGSGKSNTATVIAEEVLDLGIPVVVLDPEGEFVALADEYPVVVFGSESDADVTGGPEDARSLAARAVEDRVPVVFDLSGFADEEAERSVAAVANGLFRAELQHEIPLLLIADEMDEYLPETGKTVASKPLSRVVQRGRKRGLGILGASQRPADVSKDFVTQAEHHLWHRLRWENDVDVAKKHLSSSRGAELENLADGELILSASWRDDPERFFFRLKSVEDLASTPSIQLSLGSVPTEVPDSLLDAGESDDDDDTKSCEDCPFCRAGVEPPAHATAAVSDESGEVLGVYHVRGRSDNSLRATIRENIMNELGLTNGDSASLGVANGEVELFLDDRGIVTHEVGESQRITLGGRALAILDAQEGDYVRVLKREDRVLLERVTDRVDPLDYPVLATSEPYCDKTENDRANYVSLPTAVVRYLGTPDRIGVRHDGGEVVLTDADEFDVSYVVQGDCVMIGAKGLRPLDAREGDLLVARPTDQGEIRLTVNRGGTL